MEYKRLEKRTGKLKNVILEILRDVSDGKFVLTTGMFRRLVDALYDEVQVRLGSDADEVLGKERLANMFRELHGLTKTTLPSDPVREVVRRVFYSSSLTTQKEQPSRRGENYIH